MRKTVLVLPLLGACLTSQEDYEHLLAFAEARVVCDQTLWFLDGDGDGYGRDSAGEVGVVDFDSLACGGPTDEYVAGDCDDNDAEVSPAAVELCDAEGVDENCDGTAPIPIWAFPDLDGDGFGADAEAELLCELTDGWTTAGGDCDDSEPDAFPSNEAICGDGIDNNCDGQGDCELGLGEERDAWLGENGVATFSGAVAVGDVTGDGVVDLAIGSPSVDERPDVLIFAGPISADSLRASDASAALYSARASGTTGAALSIADLDGDGVGDLVVGDPNEGSSTGGLVQVAFGPLTGDVGLVESRSVANVSSGKGTGGGLLTLDWNGDGLSDLVFADVTEPGSCGRESVDQTGRVNLISAPFETWGDVSLRQTGVLLGCYSDSYMGRVMAPMADLDGDGAAEILLGVPGLTTASEFAELGGAVYVMTEADDHPEGSLVSPDGLGPSFVTTVSRSELGASVADAGDTDEDGYPDLLFGDPAAKDGVYDVGAAWLVSGSDIADLGASRLDADDVAVLTIAGASRVQARVGAGVMALSGVAGAEEKSIGVVAPQAELDGGDGGVFVFHLPAQGVLQLSDADLVIGPDDVAGDVLPGGGMLGDLNALGHEDLLIAHENGWAIWFLDGL